MGARPWLPMTMIACDTGAAGGYGPRGGQWQTANRELHGTRSVVSFYHPRPISGWFFHPNRLKWDELPGFTGNRYLMKDWRPGAKLESNQSASVRHSQTGSITG